jgi:hypothetical protein
MTWIPPTKHKSHADWRCTDRIDNFQQTSRYISPGFDFQHFENRQKTVTSDKVGLQAQLFGRVVKQSKLYREQGLLQLH